MQVQIKLDGEGAIVLVHDALKLSLQRTYRASFLCLSTPTLYVANRFTPPSVKACSCVP